MKYKILLREVRSQEIQAQGILEDRAEKVAGCMRVIAERVTL